jgi:hypothetical protein
LTKTKHMLYLIVIVGLLLPMSALAVDDTPMWVHRFRLIWTERATGYPDAVVAFIHIRDADNRAVEGAKVEAEWTSPYWKEPVAVVSTTNRQGIAIFRVWHGPGWYHLCVHSVSKGGRNYDSELNRDDACQAAIAY